MDFTKLVTELGIDKLSEEDRQEVMGQLLSSLQKRVGLRLAEVLTDEQMDHIQKVTKQQGYDAATKELEHIYPDYQKVYQEEIDKMIDRMKAMGPA